MHAVVQTQLAWLPCAGARLRQWAHLDDGQPPPAGFEDVKEWREFEIPFKVALATLVRLVATRFPAEAILDAVQKLPAALQAATSPSELSELVSTA